jgi:hypothetical protein
MNLFRTELIDSLFEVLFKVINVVGVSIDGRCCVIADEHKSSHPSDCRGHSALVWRHESTAPRSAEETRLTQVKLNCDKIQHEWSNKKRK